ncbi:recombinase family protein [Mycetohabitans sp. B46]|uniref:recombinase family protein n=1 Tax=Mycetohabitans sp. B46 TaxID=2772536 RepID=UPI003FD4AA60
MSTVKQKAEFETQLEELRTAGYEQLFQEQVSLLDERIQLAAALEYVCEGDVLVVTKLDRLVRSIADLMATVQTLQHKGVSLRVLNLGMDTYTETGKLMLTVLNGIAQFERETMLDRQREGVAEPRPLATASTGFIVWCKGRVPLHSHGVPISHTAGKDQYHSDANIVPIYGNLRRESGQNSRHEADPVARFELVTLR